MTHNIHALRNVLFILNYAHTLINATPKIYIVVPDIQVNALYNIQQYKTIYIDYIKLRHFATIILGIKINLLKELIYAS